MRFLRWFVLCLLATGLVWGAVVWYWQVSHRDMTMNDIVLDMVVLPLAVIGLMLASRWAWLGARKRASAQATASEPTGEGLGAIGAVPAEAGKPAAPGRAPIKLLSAQVLSAAGGGAPEMLEAARLMQPVPELDPLLCMQDGLPATCARIRGLDEGEGDDDLRCAIAEVIGQDPLLERGEVQVHVMRAMAALRQPLKAAFQDLRTWAASAGTAISPPSVPREPSPSAAPIAPAARSSSLNVVAAWPKEWGVFEQAVAQAWLGAAVKQEAAAFIAPERILLDARSGTGEELWMRADQVLQTAARESRRDLVLVAACDSGISQAAIESAEVEHLLFSAKVRPRGRMPGEAAAVLVLAPSSWPDAPDAEPDTLRLMPAAVARRDRSIEVDGRGQADCVSAVLDQAIVAAGLTGGDIGALVCDADKHSARPTELYGAALVKLPQLDSIEDMRLLGTCTGHAGVASPLLVVAAAAAHARGAGRPTMALTLGDAFARLALVVQPKGIASA